MQNILGTSVREYIQRYLMTNSYVFYMVANSYKFVQLHSYDFVRFL